MNPMDSAPWTANKVAAARLRGSIGVVTGSGPEAGVDLWQKILSVSRSLVGASFCGDLDAPRVRILSDPILGLSMELKKHEAEVWACLRRCISEISQSVVSFGIACNTLHYFQPHIAQMAVSARFVSIVDVVREELRREGVQRVALLGSASVMSNSSWSPYQKLYTEFDLEDVPPPAVHELIYAVKTFGGSASVVKESFARILGSLRAEVVVLACTELPLISLPSGAPRTIDPSLLLATELVRSSLGNEATPLP